MLSTIDRYSILNIDDKIYLYNNLTGLFFKINKNVSDYINNNKTFNEKLNNFLLETHFKGDFRNIYESLYPKISPNLRAISTAFLHTPFVLVPMPPRAVLIVIRSISICHGMMLLRK